MRTISRLFTAFAVALFAIIGLAPAAFAHNQLVSSTPADKASLESGPSTIELTFDQPVQSGKGLNSVVVVGPNGTDQWQSGEASVRGNVVTAQVRALGPAGDYRIGYRILSADGHPVAGELKFSLTRAGNGTPAPVEATQNTGSAKAGEAQESGGVPVWVWIAGAVVLLGAGVFFAMRVGGGAQQ
ncbi:copper resistance CopC family protein [Actinokineospora xionganensis]|uniref:Copper resistance protein CopC n=1 Tax=Actinokineospora xionganensis TaxID=2684470 RepID=A0ABR7L9E3_9PSEU|nr:copper resistance CopC family protein [Actinokineospora xionganensis]MBC6449259.1 copper resistance protein CopC [Actinokineospora xionganensis]